MLITAIVITLELQLIMYQLVIHTYISVADSDLELRRGPGLDLLALLAFFPSVISSFFLPKIKGVGRVPRAPPLDPPPYLMFKFCSCYM